VCHSGAGLQQVEILAQVRGLQGGSVAALVQFLSGVVGPDGLAVDAMAWCAHGLTAVSVREYLVNVEDNLGVRLQPIRSPKDFLTVQHAAFMYTPPLTMVQLELNERAAEQSREDRIVDAAEVYAWLYSDGCPVTFLTKFTPSLQECPEHGCSLSGI
jgi:hypothetical protein